ncbi:hypothetical protein ACVWYG_003886 [Pedobacter sp. UYEF25]
MMHSRIIAFLNAVLIEDVKENIKNIQGFNINNTNLSDDIFVQNLQHLNRISHSLAFSRWIISCPILIPYINLTDKLFHVISEFVNWSTDDDLQKFQMKNTSSVYMLLKRVATKGNKDNKREKFANNKKSFDEIIEVLKNKNISYDLFSLAGNRAQIIEKNNYIRENLRDIFNNKVASTNLRDFRKYVISTQQQW